MACDGPVLRVLGMAYLCRWLLTAVGWPLHALTAVAAALAMYSAIAPGYYVGPCLVSVLLWLTVGLIWVGRGLLRIITASLSHTATGSWNSWRVAPLVLLVTAALLWLQVPYHAAFYLSRPFMEDAVRQVQSAPSATYQPARWIGLYGTCDVGTRPWGMVFFLHSGWPDSYGFAYSTRGTPRSGPTGSNLGQDTYTPIMGHWYEYRHNEDW